MSQGKIILMGCGSYSPPTYMHLRMFEIAKDYIHSLNLGTVVGGIVSPVHDAYGKKDLVGAHHRISMLKLALRSSGWVKVSEWETQQSGWTRTRLSLQYHQDTINNHLNSCTRLDPDPPSWLPDDILNVNSMIDETDNIMEKLNGNDNGDDNRDNVTIKLLCGADLLESFATPGLWADEDLETIVGRHGLVVVSRAGCDPGKFIYESDLLYKYRKNVVLVTNYIANEVSSTMLRRLMRRGESGKYLTDDGVLSYIRLHQLYGSVTTPAVTEYNMLNDMIANYDKKSPQDYTMASPEETKFKNILISIRDRPSIIDETITVKRPRKSNYLMPNTHTDSISPLDSLRPKMAYLDRVPTNYVPGKAVKIVSDVKKHEVTEQVSFAEANHSSLESYLTGDNECKIVSDVKSQEVTEQVSSAEANHNSLESYLNRDNECKRRVSEGNLGASNLSQLRVEKKRCSSTVRKLSKEGVKKSKSEVSKLCEKVKSLKVKDKEQSKSYKTRSCNDIVRLILTKHGIHVISDTEAIV